MHPATARLKAGFTTMHRVKAPHKQMASTDNGSDQLVTARGPW